MEIRRVGNLRWLACREVCLQEAEWVLPSARSALNPFLRSSCHARYKPGATLARDVCRSSYPTSSSASDAVQPHRSPITASASRFRASTFSSSTAPCRAAGSISQCWQQAAVAGASRNAPCPTRIVKTCVSKMRAPMHCSRQFGQHTQRRSMTHRRARSLTSWTPGRGAHMHDSRAC